MITGCDTESDGITFNDPHLLSKYCYYRTILKLNSKKAIVTFF